MKTFTNNIIGATLVAAMISAGAVAPTFAASMGKQVVASAKTKPIVRIVKNTNDFNRAMVKRQINKQALANGVKLSQTELNRATNTAMNKLASAGKDPLKGIIHLKFKRFTICIAWGKDKGHCS